MRLRLAARLIAPPFSIRGTHRILGRRFVSHFSILCGKGGIGSSAQCRTFKLAIQAPNNGHSLSAIFPVSPSPIGDFGKEQLGKDFRKAKPAGVRHRDRGGQVSASRSFARNGRALSASMHLTDRHRHRAIGACRGWERSVRPLPRTSPPRKIGDQARRGQRTLSPDCSRSALRLARGCRANRPR